VVTPIIRSQWLKGDDLQSIASRIQAPTLVMQADANAGGGLTDGDADWLEQAIPDVTGVRVSGVGHQIHTAAPDVTLRIVLGFLESLHD
jgi:pimeloyl-ACP methyl ester carboxylesterase